MFLIYKFVIFKVVQKKWVGRFKIRCEIIEFNESLESNPEKVNEDPYNEGWMIKLKMSDSSELEDLLSPEDYQNTVS